LPGAGHACLTRRVPGSASHGNGAGNPGLARALRNVALLLLAVSALLTLAGLPWLRQGVAAGRLPRAVLAAPPVLLGLFVLGYAIYRLALVRAGRYPAGKALAQAGLMVLAVVLVARMTLEPAALPAAGRLERGLRSGNADLRALAAELARYRPADEGRSLIPRLVELLDDPDVEVRREAHASLVVLVGEDLGSAEGAAARWRARLGETARPR
jgi:hypothetical protein